MYLPVSCCVGTQSPSCSLPLFFCKDTAPTGSYTLSLHDALPISWTVPASTAMSMSWLATTPGNLLVIPDRKSTRLNSSHVAISYAVFCLKKKKFKDQTDVANKTSVDQYVIDGAKEEQFDDSA